MGADYLTSSCIDIGSVATPAQVKAIINSGAIYQAILNMAGNCEWVIDDIADQVDIDITSSNGMVKAGHLTAIEAATQIWWTSRRDMSAWHGMVESGGLSHGDSPTEAYEHISTLSYIDEALLTALQVPHPNPKEQGWRLLRAIAKQDTDMTLADIRLRAKQIINTGQGALND